MLPEHLNVLRIEYPLLHGLGSPQFIPSDNQVYFLANTCQVSGLFSSGISPAHHGNHLILIKESIAGGTGRHTDIP